MIEAAVGFLVLAGGGAVLYVVGVVLNQHNRRTLQQLRLAKAARPVALKRPPPPARGSPVRMGGEPDEDYAHRLRELGYDPKQFGIDVCLLSSHRHTAACDLRRIGVIEYGHEDWQKQPFYERR